MSKPTEFYLPNFLQICDYSWSLHSDHGQVENESTAWATGYGVFKNKTRARLIQLNTGLLCGYVYPYASHDNLRIACDFVNLLFVLDDMSDEQTCAEAQKTGDVFLQSLGTNECDGSPLSLMTKESVRRSVLWITSFTNCYLCKSFKQRFTNAASINCQRRFHKHCAEYLNATIKEAGIRERGEVLTLDEYTLLRRQNSGSLTTFDLIECLLDIDIPDEIFDHPVFSSLVNAAADMICWSNVSVNSLYHQMGCSSFVNSEGVPFLIRSVITQDAYSYNKEQAMRQAGNNILTVLMTERGISLQDASNEVGRLFKNAMTQFAADKTRLPTFGQAMDTAVHAYISALETWVIGNLIWSFETLRYFGSNGLDTKKTLLIRLKTPQN